jgi:hypothetical protein
VPRVGEDLPFDAQRALDQISAEMDVAIDEIYRAMGVDPATIRKPTVADDAWMQRVRAAQAKARQSPLWPFWESSASPKYDDWQSARKGFSTKPMTREDYDRWFGRVKELRAEARDKGVKLSSPEPLHAFVKVGPPAGGFDKAALIKWGAIGAAGILGVLAISSLASSTKDERAKYDRYRYGYLSAR